MITPGSLTDTAPSERTRSRCSTIFLVLFAVLRRVVVRWLLNSGKIALTTVPAGRRHGPARIIGGPEGDRAARVAVPEPAPRAGHRRGVRGRGLLRRPRHGAGQVRDGAPVTAAAAAFGYSRPSYYQAAAALAGSGLEGLEPARPGPRGGHKLTGEIIAWAGQQLAADPALRAGRLAGPIAEQFGVRVHPRSIERALARRRGHPKR